MAWSEAYLSSLLSATVRLAPAAKRHARLGLILYIAAFLIWAGPLSNGLCALDDSRLAHLAHRALVESSGLSDQDHDASHPTNAAGAQAAPEAATPLDLWAPALTTARSTSGPLLSTPNHVSGTTSALLGVSPAVARFGLMDENLPSVLRVSPPDPPPRADG